MSSRDIDDVSFSLEINVGPLEDELRRAQTVLFRTLSLASRLTGSESLKEGIAEIQHTIILLNQLRLAYRAVQLARMAAGDPVAWALAGLSVAEVIVSTYEVVGR